MRLHALFSGKIDDGGYYESAYRGIESARRDWQLEVRITQDIGIEAADQLPEIESAARDHPDLIVVHGGRCSIVIPGVAARYPRIRFLSTHGDASGPNFSCWSPHQYQSAFLAGALAGLLTRSGTVGHLSGVRVPLGLKSRAAYVHGVRHTNASARVITCFCGTQDDSEVSYRAARQELTQGVDIMFTMLNSGRQGAITACRESGARQIGNVRDWSTTDPEVFVASAIADCGWVVRQWIDATLDNRLVHGSVREIGMEESSVVRLQLSEDIAPVVRARIDDLSAAILKGDLPIMTEYQGSEMALA